MSFGNNLAFKLIYNSPNQDSKIMATCLYQLTYRKINHKNYNNYNTKRRVIGTPTG